MRKELNCRNGNDSMYLILQKWIERNEVRIDNLTCFAHDDSHTECFIDTLDKETNMVELYYCQPNWVLAVTGKFEENGLLMVEYYGYPKRPKRVFYSLIDKLDALVLTDQALHIDLDGGSTLRLYTYSCWKDTKEFVDMMTNYAKCDLLEDLN